MTPLYFYCTNCVPVLNWNLGGAWISPDMGAKNTIIGGSKPLNTIVISHHTMGCRLCHNLDFCPDKDISTIICISELIVCIS